MAKIGSLLDGVLAVTLLTSVIGIIFGNLTNATLLAGVPTWAQTVFVLVAVFGTIYFLANAMGVKVNK